MIFSSLLERFFILKSYILYYDFLFYSSIITYGFYNINNIVSVTSVRSDDFTEARTVGYRSVCIAYVSGLFMLTSQHVMPT
jgi:hypothetical protein